jgi:hypothetical protein
VEKRADSAYQQVKTNLEVVMEFLTQPMPLKQETRAMLEDLRHATDPTICYGLSPDAAQQLIKDITEPMLMGAALPLVILNEYRWFCRELGRLFRTRYGSALAFQLELVLRKWKALGLESHSMQYLVCEVYRQLLIRRAEQVKLTEVDDADSRAQTP